MEYTQRLIHQSNYWYNDGLEKANIRDMSGAVTSLKKSLQLNRENIPARNLLGLVYYGRGEVGEALVEWILSKNLQNSDNIANYYIDKIQKNPVDLDVINQAIRKYNQSLEQCSQGGEDMAIIQLKNAVEAFPQFLKAYQLMALIYLHEEKYNEARAALREAKKLDTTNDITLRYLHELTQSRREKVIQDRRVAKERTVTYQVGNDTVIQPVVSRWRENLGRLAWINMAFGVLIGILFMWFLVMPAVTKNTKQTTNRQVVEFSEKIAEEEAQISALKTELEAYRSTSDETADAQATAASTQTSYELILSTYTSYLNGELSDSAVAEQLMQVNATSLGPLATERYNEMIGEVYPRYCETLYYQAVENYSVENYQEAIDSLTKIMQMDESYNDGKAMLMLAQTYEAMGDTDNANVWMDKVKKNYPDLDTTANVVNSAYDDYDEENYDEYNY